MDKRGKAAFFSDDDFTIEEPKVDTPPVREVPREEKKAPPVTAAPTSNPLANMVEKKDNRKHCSFTLSPDSIKKLDKIAKQNKCSRSMALDLLIQKYL